MELLRQTLLDCIEKLGLPVDFVLELRGYSKTYNGRYIPRDKKVVLYALKKNNELRDRNTLLKILIHEAIHHYQWYHDPEFKRVKGVMHNEEFKRMERELIQKAKELNLLE